MGTLFGGHRAPARTASPPRGLSGRLKTSGDLTQAGNPLRQILADLFRFDHPLLGLQQQHADLIQAAGNLLCGTLLLLGSLSDLVVARGDPQHQRGDLLRLVADACRLIVNLLRRPVQSRQVDDRR